ncbi:MAG: zf-HC2 domain-containing protein [Oscillospiraceae bacterium]|nr:zf-HC2 domain-containing protein [Oscillospiraceae bacterium]
MSEKNLDCKIIEDLLPLYSENLCSQESKNLIQEHVKTCETCKQLLKKIPISEIKPEIIPEEKKAFLKINRKLKLSILRTACLTLLSSGLLIGIGYLSYGQVAKNPDFQSFETIWQNIEAKKFAKTIATGDFDSYLETVSLNTEFDFSKLPYGGKQFLGQIKNNLEEIYQDTFGDTGLKSIKINTCYETCYENGISESIPVSDVSIIYADGQEVNFYLYRNLDGKFFVNSAYISDNNGLSDKIITFENCLHYVSYPEIDPNEFFAKVITALGLRADEEKGIVDEKERNRRLQFLTAAATGRFAPEYREQLKKNILEFYQQGYYMNECYFSKFHYDKEKNLLYQLMTITAEDSQGSAVLITKIYSDYNGLIPPSQDMGKVYQDNCTEQLAENLLKLFG